MRKTFQFMKGDKESKSKKLTESASELNLSLSAGTDDPRKLRKTQSTNNASTAMTKSDPVPVRTKRPRPEAHQMLWDLDLLEFHTLDPLLKTVDDNLNAFLSQADKRGQVPFHVLATGEKFSVFQYLLLKYPDKTKLNVNVTDRSGWSPLHVACDSGHIKTIGLLLLINKCDVAAQEIDRSTVLHYFIRRFPSGEKHKARFQKCADLVKDMVERGLDVNARNRWGETALHKAVMAGDPFVVRWFLKNKEWNIELNSTNRMGETPLHFAAREGKAEVTRVLLEYGADQNIAGSNGTPLDVATKSQKDEVVEILKAHAEGNGTGWKSVNLQDAKSDDNPADASKRTDNNASAFSHDLIRKNDLKGLKQQIAAKGFEHVMEQIDITGKTLFHVVCGSANLTILRYLLLNYNNITLDVKDRSGMTPLHLACFSLAHSEKNLRMVKFLIINNLCDVKAKAKDGSTTFHYFMRYFYDGESKRKLLEYLRVAALFLAKGIDINAKNRHGETPLHSACLAGRLLAINWLIRHGAEINATTRAGETCLHLATRNGEVDVVLTLLGLGVDVTVEGQNGTALDLAKTAQNKEIIEALEESCTPSKSKEQKLQVLDADSADTTDETVTEADGDESTFDSNDPSEKDGKKSKKEQKKERKLEKKRAKKEKKKETKSNDETNKKKKRKKKKKKRNDKDEGPVVKGSVIRENRPPAHIMTKNGDWLGLSKLIKEQGIRNVITTRDARGQTVLHVAIDKGDMDILANLLNFYPDRLEQDLNLQDRNGWSPLHSAAALGEIDILLLLLSSKRFNASLVSTDGSTPLHYLMRRFPDTSLKQSADTGDTVEIEKFCRAVRILIDNGANIRAQNNNMETVLHSAAMAGSPSALLWLINNEKWSFNINAVTKRGETCLHLAARSGRMKAVRLLLELGIEDKIKGVNGTALELARKAGQKEVVALLEDYASHPENYKRSAIDENVVDVVDSLFDAAYASVSVGLGTSLSFQHRKILDAIDWEI